MFLAAIASVTTTAEVIATYCYTETQKKNLQQLIDYTATCTSMCDVHPRLL